MTPAPDRSEAGETLLELLIAVTIMGIALVAIVGGLVTTILISDVHRKQAVAGAFARDYGAAIQNVVAAGGYQPCNAPTYAGAVLGTPGYTKSITGSWYWNGSSWQATCGTDTGLQKVRVQVRSTDGRAVESVDVVLRKPCRISDPSC
ncbi:type IV pilus modification PilV family protein [Labedaea rhizosphaerae]|uniref:Type II secretory pathway pseudopilin PulG n=1 Tax=Labedaea rhizosphaerae TaxID=598644 RepID=A0A4R6SA35_LABRH|nr:type II secretion system protein [Labedaea rhizosphaerae]TDP96770.1 type II secretory pathway pseudopilin PulG [Labedaea rhizosphaerae]